MDRWIGGLEINKVKKRRKMYSDSNIIRNF